MAYVAVGVGIVGVSTAMGIGGAVLGNLEAAEAQRKAIKMQRLAAKAGYSSTEDSVNIMKAVAREQTTNAVAETLREGAAQFTDVKQEVQSVTSKAVARGEGLTSGASRGRALITLQIKGQEALSKSKSQTSSQVNQLVDQQDKITNDLNNQLLTAYQDMASVLSNEGAAITGNTSRALSGAMSGAASGASLAGAVGSSGGSGGSGGAQVVGGFSGTNAPLTASQSALPKIF